MEGFADLGDLPEDERIKVIGDYMMGLPKGSDVQPKTVGIVVGNNTIADRYCKKIKEKYPKIRIIKKAPGPVLGTVLLKLGEPLR